MTSDRRRLIMMGIRLPSPLPDGAIECEGIFPNAFVNNSFIETGITPGINMSYETRIKWVVPSGAVDAFGYNIGGHAYDPFRFYQRNRNMAYDAYYSLGTPNFPSTIDLKCKAVLTQTGATVDYYLPDGTLYQTGSVSYDETDYTPGKTLPLLGKKTSDTAIESATFRGAMGRTKFYDDDHFGHLIADFIPCYYNGNFGMWEVVSQTFLTGYTPENILGYGKHWDTQGFWPHTAGNGNLTSASYGLTDDRSYINSRVFPLPTGCTSIRFNCGTVNGGGKIFFYRANGNYYDYFNYNTQDRVVTVNSVVAQVRLQVKIYNPTSLDDLNNSYIYDVTHGQYIWKGINVQ